MDKMKQNTKTLSITRQHLEDLIEIENKIPKHWYKLKYAVGYMHATYRLLHSVLSIYAPECNTRNQYHYLIFGPRRIGLNHRILRVLLRSVLHKLRHLGEKIHETLRVKFQDIMTRILTRINRAIRTFWDIYWNASDIYDSKLTPYSMAYIYLKK